MRAEDFLAFEARMKEKGYKRGSLCEALGVSQSKWRRIVDSPDGTQIDDRTLELACSALEAGLHDRQPAAWLFECLERKSKGGKAWLQRTSLSRPRESDDIRDVRPLYL